MNAYTGLAACYDALMDHAGYAAWADFAERQFARLPRPVRLVLDLACGTGTLALLLSERGYDVIAVDGSEDMLSHALLKGADLPRRPLFLCQTMQSLNLYGTVDAALCSMDGLNYLTCERDLHRALERVHLFLEPGGLFLFDTLTPEHFAACGGRASVNQTEDVYCVWHTDWNPRRQAARHSVNFFVRERDGLWHRHEEWHAQTAYSPETWERLLRESGFTDIRMFGDRVMRRPRPGEHRVFFAARKPDPSGPRG